MNQKIMSYIPKSKIEAVRDAYKDEDGYWICLNEGWEASRTDSGCRTIHEDTIKELRYQIAGIQRIEAQEATEIKTAAEEAFAKRDRHEDVTTYTEYNGQEVELTTEELAWFRETAEKCKKATGYENIPITAFNTELYRDDVLGCCHVNNGEMYILIDTWFIHEKYLEAFEGYPIIDKTSLIDVICHELAHLTVWDHNEAHTQKMQELKRLVEAYEEPKPEPEPAQLPRPVIQPGPGATEAVMFGVMMVFAVTWFIVKNVAELLALTAGMLLIRLWSRRDDIKAALIEVVEAGSRWTVAACKKAVAVGAILVFMVRIALQ